MRTLFKSIKMAIVILMFSGTAVFADLSDILKSGTVKIAVPEAFAPFGSVGASGEREGYDVDVAKLIAKDLGVKLELVPVVSKQRIPFLETNRVDLVISTMGANPKRAKSINFSSAYAPFYSGVFAASSIEIFDSEDLDGLTIGVTGGTLEDLELTESAPKGAKITRFGDNAATLSAGGKYSTSSRTRGVFGGGSPDVNNTLEYVEIATTGNATDFGDFQGFGRRGAGQEAISNAHGGL